jgi:2-C-methyl-D-erythritol 4-phosphate cytidylyltransferase
VKVAGLVPAAGRGERLGPGAPKALREVGGQPLLVHAVRALSSARTVSLVVVAAPEQEVAFVRSLLAGVSGDAEVVVVAGGPTRRASVAAALEVLPPDVDVVLVHDAARPLAPPELVDSVASAVDAGADAVVPGMAMPDTVKQVDPAGRVEQTLDRTSLRAVQTPQGFRPDVLRRAHAAAADDDVATDDAALVERIGGTVLVIPGSEEAFKVTRPLDLVLAEAVLARRRSAGNPR